MSFALSSLNDKVMISHPSCARYCDLHSSVTAVYRTHFHCLCAGVVSADEIFTIIEGENLAPFLENLDEGKLDHPPRSLASNFARPAVSARYHMLSETVCVPEQSCGISCAALCPRRNFSPGLAFAALVFVSLH